MSKIQELIDRMCPEGVDYLPLSDVGCFIRGNGIQKKDFTPEGVGCIHYGQIHTHYGTFATKTLTRIPQSIARKCKMAHKGDLVIATTSEDAEGVCKAVAWLGNEDVAVSGDAYIFRHNLDPKYVSYIFQTNRFLTHKKKYANGTKVVRMSESSMGKFLIPVPPLEVQREIVKVLDSFSEHTAALVTELDAELAARKKQYVHYQKVVVEELSHGSPMMALADICSVITDGSHFSPSATDSEEYFYMPSVKNMHDNCFDFSSCKRIGKRDYEVLVSNGCQPHLNDVLIAKDGATMLKYVFVVKEEKEIVVLSSIAILRPEMDLIYPEYLAHYFRQEWFRQYVINKFSSKAGVPRIVLKNFKRIEIPVPSIEAQKRIVSILDKFETLTLDFAESLSAEIKARQQQYEFYRDQLLTFKRAN